MKKYFNGAIFFKEMKLAKWYAAGVLFAILSTWLPLFLKTIDEMRNSIGNIYEVNNRFSLFIEGITGSNNVNTILMAIIFSAVIVGLDRGNRRYEVLSAMGFTRNEIIGTKWITAIGIFIVPMVLCYISMTLIYFKNLDLFNLCENSVTRLLMYFAINLLVYIFIVSFIMLIQCLSGSVALGGVLGSIFLVLPAGLNIMIPEFVSLFVNTKYKVDSNLFMGAKEVSGGFSEFISIVTYNINFGGNFGNRILILIISIVSIVTLIIYSFNKNEIEKTGYVAMFKSLEYILKIGVSFCFAMLLAIIVTLSIEAYAKVNFNKGVTAMITFVIAGVIVYILSNKYIESKKV